MTEPPELAELVAPGLFAFAAFEGFGAGKADANAVFAFDVLLELVEQLPFEPLTLDALGVCAVDELPLQLYAFATFGAMVIGATIIADTSC